MQNFRKTLIGLFVSGIATAGCVAVPVNTDGTVSWEVVPAPFAPLVMADQPVPVTMSARLYPTNAIGRETGMLSGSVTNLRTGKGRFQLNYRGETLTGEATRASSADPAQGMANAASPRGTYMNCEYRMNTPRQGSGRCTMSDGATYDVHLGG